MTTDQEEKHEQGKTGKREGGFNIGRDLIAQNSNLFGRDGTVTQNIGVTDKDFLALFEPLWNEVNKAPQDVQIEAKEKINELVSETAKGKKADDGRLATIIKGITDLIPGAVGALVSMFASPILGGLAGPVTKIVLKNLGVKEDPSRSG